MSWLTGVLSLASSLCGMLAKYFGLKNEPDQKRAAAADQLAELEDANTKAVRDAIRTGNLDELRK